MVVLTALLLGTGCAGLRDVVPGLSSSPTARLVSPRIERLSLTSVTVGAEAEVQNPYPVALPLLGLRYALRTGDDPLVEGLAQAQGTVPAGGSRAIPLAAEVDLREVLRLLPTLRAGEVIPYALDVTLSVDVPAVGAVDLPLRHEGRLPVPAPPRVELREVVWEELSLSGVRGVASLGLTNPNRFGIDLDELSYRLTLGGRRVVGGAAEPASRSLAPDGTTTVRLPLEMGSAELGLAVLQALGQASTDYAVSLTLDLGTPFGPLRLDLSEEGLVPLRR